MVISRTPFRISFFGGGTDYPVWFKKEEGAVISTTIDKYCYLNVRYLPPFFEHTHRIVYSRIENVKYISEIKHPAVKAVLEYLKIDKGLEVHHDGDLPARSGLGSSSAFTVGLINSLYALLGKIISKEQLAHEAIYIEREVLKENVGSQDQVAVAFGGFNKITFKKDGAFLVEPITISKERIEQLQNHLILVYTGLSRIASKVTKEQIKNIQKKNKELRLMRMLVDEAIKILNSNKSIIEFGHLLNESWKIKKSLSDKITNMAIDNIYESALRGGAIGGKILGAGAGGFMLLFVPPEAQRKVKTALKNLLVLKFSFENLGSQIIYYSPQDIEKYENQFL